MLSAFERVVEGMEHSSARYMVRLQWVCSSPVTVERQSTTVPKTSKRRARTDAMLAGWAVDMVGEIATAFNVLRMCRKQVEHGWSRSS